MNNDELKQLALDIHEGKVFGTWNIPENESPDTAGVVFMPAILGAEIPEDVVHLYEYIEKAGPRSVNGMPIFMSMHILKRYDHEKLVPMINELKKQREEFLKGDDK